MGTLTIGSRKRGHDFDTLNCETPSLSSTSFKKSRFLTSFLNQAHNTPRREHRSLILRYRQYPDPKPNCKREPLAPVRQSRFGFYPNSNSSGSNRVNSPRGMGNIFGKGSKPERESSSKFLRFDEKDGDLFESNDDEVVEVVNLEEKEPSGNSGIEEDDIVEDEKYHDWNSRGIVNGDLGVQSEENMLRSWNKESVNMGLKDFKFLLSNVQSDSPHLASFRFQINFTEKKLQAFQQSRPQRKDEVEVEAEAFVDAFRKEMVTEAFKPLSDYEKKQVNHAFSNSQRRMLLVTHESSNIDITGEVLRCLRPGMWLNDEVINLYFELLKEREKRDPGKFLKCHFFNTFFYKKLISGSGKDGYNFQSVRRWTTQKKLGYCLFDCDMIFIPIHKNIHWCLAIINKKEQKFQYLDSLGCSDSYVLKILARYFVDEVKEKSGKDIDVSLWTQENVEDLPEQRNGFDCGVFMIKYADFYSRGIGLCFNQENMTYFRQRTAKEILHLKAE